MGDLAVPNWVVGLGIVVIILIAAGVYLRFFYTPEEGELTYGNDSDSKYTPNIGWSEATPIENSTCTTYQFPFSMTSSSYSCGLNQYQGNFISSTSPSLNNLNVATPISFQNCVDSDQINAIRLVQYCNKVFDDSNDSNVAWCFDAQGKRYEYGDSYEFFGYCNESSTLKVKNEELLCPGSIGGLSVGFQSENFNYLPCMKYNGNIFVGVTQCDLTDDTQIFRIMRTTNLNSKPGPTTNEPAGNDGPYISLIYRKTGQCVVPQTRYPSLNTTLTLGNPDEWNGGFIWYLVPPINYNIYWDGSQCTAAVPCNRDSQGNLINPLTPEGCSSLTQGVTSSQQLVYIGGTSQPDFLLNSKNSMQIVQFLQNPNNYTYAINNNDGDITLQLYRPYGNNCITDGNSQPQSHSCNATNSAVNFAAPQMYNTLAASCNWFDSGTGCVN